MEKQNPNRFISLISPQWKSIYLPLWFQEDFPYLDIASAIVGDAEAQGQIIFKSVRVIYAHFNINLYFSAS